VFDIDEFVADCTIAIKEAQPRLAIKELLERAVRNPDEVARALPATRAEVVPLYASEELTVMKVVWSPGLSFGPHDHRMWVAVGLYGGQEDNTFYRRSGGGIVVSGGRELYAGDVALLGDDAIHAVVNPLRAFTGALHVYGGNLPARTDRSEWDLATQTETSFDFARVTRQFEEANAGGAEPTN
jgi:predicted metal-dependent enzyme (double-stranded beta helix superfamily)